MQKLRQPVILFTGAVIVIIALGAAFHSPIDRQMRRWKLLPEPERLTELYFTEPNNVPKSYTPGGMQTVKFTVHNLEYRNTTYTYQITEISQDGQKSSLLAMNSFTLEQNEYHKEAVNISTTDLGPSVKVEVKLMNVNESIDYLLDREAS